MTIPWNATFAAMRLRRRWVPGFVVRRLFGFGLPEAEGGSGGVEDDAEVAGVGDLGDVLHDLGAEGFGFGGGDLEVVDLDVGEPGGGRSGDGMLHQAAAGTFAGLDEGVGSHGAHVHVVVGPAKEAGVEGFCFGWVGGAEFHVTEGVCHGGVLSSRGEWLWDSGAADVGEKSPIAASEHKAQGDPR